MSKIYDVAVIGAGPAGYVAAIRASQLGANVVLIEKNALGGVCMNVGCIPTKAFVKSAEVYSETKSAKEFGVIAQSVSLEWNNAVTRKNRIVKMLGKGVEHLMSANAITVLNGEAKVKSTTEIAVMQHDNTEITVNCTKMIITSGSRPLIPSFIKGSQQEGVITSTQALELTDIPQSMLVIGGGVIGIEFATIFAEAGCKVTVFELEDKILPQEDDEVCEQLLRILKRKGIKFELGAKVSEIEKQGENLIVNFTKNDVPAQLEGENVLLALGRTLNSDVFENINLKTENGRIVVDDYMKTSIDNIYAAGDVIGGKLLAHLSFFEGRIAAENAMGLNKTINYNIVPACVYTAPEVASVGLTQKQAQEQGIVTKIGKFDFRVNGRAQTLSQRDGFVKIVADEQGIIIGAQILGPNASEMISELTLAIALRVSASTLSDIIHPHPSLSEAIWEACNNIAGVPIHN